jgi:hypothetical protein
MKRVLITDAPLLALGGTATALASRAAPSKLAGGFRGG